MRLNAKESKMKMKIPKFSFHCERTCTCEQVYVCVCGLNLCAFYGGGGLYSKKKKQQEKKNEQRKDEKCAVV